MTEIVARIGNFLGGGRLSKSERRDRQFVVGDRQGALMLGYAGLLILFALISGVSGGLIALAGNKVLALAVADVFYGITLFCLVATAYHGLLSIYSLRLYRQRRNLDWLVTAERLDYGWLVVVLATWFLLRHFALVP